MNPDDAGTIAFVGAYAVTVLLGIALLVSEIRARRRKP